MGLLVADRDSQRGSRRWPDRIEINRSTNDIREDIQTFVDRRYLSGLDQTEMPLGQRETILAHNRTEKAHVDPLERRRHQRKMPLACHAIENHAGDINLVAILRTTECHRRSRLGLAADIQHQHHRPPKKTSQIGGRAATPPTPPPAPWT